MPTDQNIGSLEDEAKKRKERLEALKNKQNANQSNENGEKQILPKPKFRSYNPQNEDLKQNLLPKAVPESVDEQIKEQLEAAKPEPLINEVDLTSIAPRKIDWDLKRNLSKKLDKLEKRTQRAIAELIRTRLKEGNTDLAEATQAMYETKKAHVDEDD